MADTAHDELRNTLSSMITGTESPPIASSSSSSSSNNGPQTPLDEDWTPFPSPQLSATSLAGLSCEHYTLIIQVVCMLTFADFSGL